MEKILRIEEATFSVPKEGYYSSFDGLQVVTDQQTIKVGIENGQSCCEKWGFVTSEDDFSQFVDAELISVTLTDAALNTITELPDMYEGGCMFVNFTTSKGVLQFVAYNDHNGYYSHEAVVVSRDLNNREYL